MNKNNYYLTYCASFQKCSFWPKNQVVFCPQLKTSVKNLLQGLKTKVAIKNSHNALLSNKTYERKWAYVKLLNVACSISR